MLRRASFLLCNNFTTFTAISQVDFCAILKKKTVASAQQAGRINGRLEKVLKQQSILIKQMGLYKTKPPGDNSITKHVAVQMIKQRVQSLQRELKVQTTKHIYAHQKVASSVITLADNLQSAIKEAAQKDAPQKDREQIISCRQELMDLLRKWEIVEFDPTGQVLNPQYHHVIDTVEVKDRSQVNKVVSTGRTGFMIGQRVLRHASVTIAK